MTQGVRAPGTTFVAATMLFVAGLVLLVIIGFLTWPLAAFFFVVETAFPAVGLFIVARTRNRVGWVFLIAGLALGIQSFSYAYGEYGLVHHPGAVPGASLIAWVGEVAWLPQLVLATMFLFLLFPDGRLPSRRWRWVVGLGAAGVLLVETSIVFAPTLHSHPNLRAPLAGLVPDSVVNVLANIGTFVALPAMLLALASVGVRYRRAGTVGRQQIKWFAFAAGAFLTAQMAFNVFELGQDNLIATLLNGFSALLIPLAVAIAVLRYRLYDIDVVINRTLVYATLTAFLAGVYFATVLVLGPLVTPARARTDLAVAASTLAVAALFRPARARIQGAVDRRFYRKRYDAARAVEAFAARVRQEVDLSGLIRDLERTVSETLGPEVVFISLVSQRVAPKQSGMWTM
jgi:hypothetical protein